MHDYSLMEKSMGEMVLVFPLGKLVLWYSMLGERRVHGYFPLGLPAGGEGGFMLTPCWERGWVKWLWSSHWGSWFMVTPRWGRGWVAWFLPAGGEGGCMVTPHWERGLSVCKVLFVVVLDFLWLILSVPWLWFSILYFNMYFNLFWLLVSCDPFFFRYLVI